MRSLTGVAFLLFLPVVIGGGCGEEERHYVANAGSRTPTMTTRDVSTFISDSGYTRYHLETPVWYVYDDTAEPFWRFPSGIELEQYDNFHRVSSTVVCDSAIYYSRKRLWQLDGNVVMVSTEGDSFLTEQLFWEQETRRIRSDSFIHIVRSYRILEGYGFESDQSMKDYIINNPTAILPGQRPQPKDSAERQPDSLRGAPVRPSERVRAEAPAATPEVQETGLHRNRPKSGELRSGSAKPSATPATPRRLKTTK